MKAFTGGLGAPSLPSLPRELYPGVMSVEDENPRLSPMQERFAQLLVVKRQPPKEAMTNAGYAPLTVERKGPIFLLQNPKVAARIEVLKQGQLQDIPTTMADPLLRLPGLVGKAMTVLENLLDGKPTIVVTVDAKKQRIETEEYPTPATQLRAAHVVLELTEGLLAAKMPGRRGAPRHISVYNILLQKGLVPPLPELAPRVAAIIEAQSDAGSD